MKKFGMKGLFKSPHELKKATNYSMRGIQIVWTGEKAFRSDVVAFVLSVIITGVLRYYTIISVCELILMVYSVFMILIAELVNTAIEITINRISSEYHELSGQAKDVASAIVFASLLGAAGIWMVVLIQAGIRFFG